MTSSCIAFRALARAPLAALFILVVVLGLLPRGETRARAQGGKDSEEKVGFEELVGRCVAVHGGEAPYRRLASTRAVYMAQTQHENPGLRVKYRWTVSKRSDGAIRVENVFEPAVEIYGTDGTDFWWKPMRSKKVVDAPAPMAEALRLEGRLQSFLLDYEKLGYSASLHPRDGHTVTFRLRSATSGQESPGDVIHITFDEERHWMTKLSMVIPDRDGGSPYPSSVEYQDYRKVQGVPVPHTLVIYRGETKSVVAKLDKVEIGAKLENALFVRP